MSNTATKHFTIGLRDPNMKKGKITNAKEQVDLYQVTTESGGKTKHQIVNDQTPIISIKTASDLKILMSNFQDSFLTEHRAQVQTNIDKKQKALKDVSYKVIPTSIFSFMELVTDKESNTQMFDIKCKPNFQEGTEQYDIIMEVLEVVEHYLNTTNVRVNSAIKFD